MPSLSAPLWQPMQNLERGHSCALKPVIEIDEMTSVSGFKVGTVTLMLHALFTATVTS